MKTKASGSIWAGAVIAGFLCASPTVTSAGGDLSPAATGEVDTITKLLAENPKAAIDLTAVSGEYCLNANIGKGGHMTHYAVDTGTTKEDIIDFVNAQSLVDAGINVQELPRFPGELGTMEPNQWYYLPAGEHDPHHNMQWKVPLLMRASNIN